MARADVTYTVDTGSDRVDIDTDDGICRTSVNTCSLRAAIMQANHRLAGGTATIMLPAGFYELARPINGDNGDLNLTQANTANEFIAIVGAGAAVTIIDGNQLDGVFTIEPGRTAGIRGVTIRNGRRQGSGSGGGVKNRGTLVIADCTIQDNYTASGGGGIYNESLLSLVRTTIAGNTAQSNGGGIYSSGTLTVSASTIRGNFARANFGQGGGMYLSGAASVRSSSVYQNAANNGGGLLTIDQLTVVNSTISSNRADLNGGGIFNFGNTFLYGTSVVGNDADYDGPGNGIGGGVYADNTGGHRLVMVNTLVASNTLRDLPIYNDCEGTVEVYGFNLLSDLAGCSFSGNGNAARGVVARSTIDGLANNFGPTLTHALLPGSQAIDATTTQGCIDNTGAVLASDQRGAPRIAGGRGDVGAFEFGAVVDSIFRHGFE
ncbi:MAG: choice-of-anchor Q domain-containing protein [Dokdonella sp.]